MKVRTAAGTKPFARFSLRTAAGRQVVQRASLRTSTGLKTIYASGATSSVVYITPAITTTTSSTSADNTSQFTANIAGTPSLITWSIDGTPSYASITAGQGTKKASVQLQAERHSTATCTVRCTVTIDGVSYSATATKSHTWT